MVKNPPATQETQVQSLGWEDPLEKEMATYSIILACHLGGCDSLPSQCSALCVWTSLVAQLVKNPPATQETQVQFLSWEAPLEKGSATHSTVLGQEVSGGPTSKASSVFTATPHCSYYHLSSASCQISSGLRFS